MGELVGSNVTILMPRPFSQRHDGYLASYKSSRMPKVIGRERMLIGLHKDGSAFPLRLMVSNIVKVILLFPVDTCMYMPLLCNGTCAGAMAADKCSPPPGGRIRK